MQHVDEGLLHAWLDGELPALGPAREAEVRRHLAGCAECRTRLEEARGIREQASALLRGDPVGGEVPPFEALAARGGAPARRPRGGAALVWAASVVLALGAGWLARSTLQGPEPAREPDGGALAVHEPAPPPPGAAAPAEVEETAPEPEQPQAKASPPPVRSAEPRVAERPAVSTDPPPAPAIPEVAVRDRVAIEDAAPEQIAPRTVQARARLMALHEAESTRRRTMFSDSAPFALEGLVVAATPAGEGASKPDGWLVVGWGEARRLLGREPLRVRGLPVVAVHARRTDGREAIRVRQALGGGAILSLVQTRDLPGPEAAPTGSAPATGGRDAPEEDTRLVRRVDGITVTGSAPVPPDSLGRLLERLW